MELKTQKMFYNPPRPPSEADEAESKANKE
jgi:hypothetical protein